MKKDQYKISSIVTPPSPELNKSTFTFKMLQIMANFVTFQNVAIHAHFMQSLMSLQLAWIVFGMRGGGVSGLLGGDNLWMGVAPPHPMDRCVILLTFPN